MKDEGNLLPVKREENLPARDLMAQQVPGRSGSPAETIRRLLRGRMLPAILLAVLGGVLGGLAGYRSETPIYRSSTSVELRANRPHLLYEDGVSTAWAKVFAQMQMERLQSRDVIANKAIRDAALKKAYEATGRQVPRYQEFLEELGIRSSGAHFITVSFEDPDKRVAQAAVQAVVDAYWWRYGTAHNSEEEVRLSKLEDLHRRYKLELEDIKASILTVAPHGEAAVEENYKFQQRELVKLQGTLQDVRTQIELLEAELNLEAEKEKNEKEAGKEEPGQEDDGAEKGDGAAAGGDAPAHEEEALPYQEEMDRLEVLKIALVDEKMATNLKRLRELIFRRAEWRKIFGPKNLGMKALETEIRLLAEQILDYARAWRDQNGSPTGKIQQLAALKRQRKRLEDSEFQRSSEAESVAKTYGRLLDLKEELVEKEERIARVKEEIEKIRVEREAGGRIVKPSPAYLPEIPYDDKRVQMGAVGALLGAALGFGLILLIGLLDRRVRTTEDLKEQSKGPGLLGLLPQIPRDLQDQEQLEIAARCVHEIRALLQIRNRKSKGNVFCVTSPAPGTGKTTLSIALGLSFSASGANTLIVDLDLVGKGLTDRFNTMLLQKLEMEVEADEATNGSDSAESRRSLLQFLLLGDRGRFRREWSSAELWALLEKAVDRLGIHRVKENGFLRGILVLAGQSANFSGDERWETLLSELGMLGGDTPDLESFLGSTRGVSCALSGDELGGCVMPSGLPNLSLLPNISGQGKLSTDLSPVTIGELIESARQRFDTVILDTGPIPGSLEASMAAAQADGVLFTISRGEQRPLVDGALTHLQAIGARPAGLVFNRANRKDVKRNSRSYYSYNYSHSHSSTNGGRK